jgi:hypothetical protein
MLVACHRLIPVQTQSVSDRVKEELCCEYHVTMFFFILCITVRQLLENSILDVVLCVNEILMHRVGIHNQKIISEIQ